MRAERAAGGLFSGRETGCRDLFVENPESAMFPNQQLHAVTATVQKDINIAGERVAQHGLSYHAAQPVKAFTHVGGMAIKVEPKLIDYRQHGSTLRPGDKFFEQGRFDCAGQTQAHAIGIS